MNPLIFLIVFPLVISGLALVLPHGTGLRRTIGVMVSILLCAVPIYLLVTYLDQGPAYFHAESHVVNMLMLAMEVFIAAFIVYISLRAKQYLPVLLVVVQSLIMATFELTAGRSMERASRRSCSRSRTRIPTGASSRAAPSRRGSRRSS